MSDHFESDPGSVDGVPVFTTHELADVHLDVARRAILGDQTWEPVPQEDRTPLDEVPHIVAEGEDWVQYSDGETMFYDGDIPFYLE